MLAGRTHKFSPKKFTQHQLFACLVLKTFLKTDYRGLAAHLADHFDIREPYLETVPHFTTPQKASRRLLCASLEPEQLFHAPCGGFCRPPPTQTGSVGLHRH